MTERLSVIQNDTGGWEFTCPIHGLVASGPDRPIIAAAASTHSACALVAAGRAAVPEPALREQILATLRRHIGAHADIVTNDLMQDVEEAMHQAYQDGESSGYADWALAFDDILPDDVEAQPSAVAGWVRSALAERNET